MAQTLEQKFRGIGLRLRRQVPLAPLVTFGLGGVAEYLVTVRRPDELAAAWRLARSAGLKINLIAGGSNVVPPDGLLSGLTIHYRASRGGLARSGARSVLAEAGIPLARLINFAIKNDLAGLESLSGIPGTVGGAIVGNAGAYGQCVSDHLDKIEIFDGRRVRRLTKEDCRFAYRESAFKTRPDWIVRRASFRLLPGKRADLIRRSREIIKIRLTKYAPGLKCPGSFFKNVLAKDVPANRLAGLDQSKIIDGKIPAGYLLEAVGARGRRRGGIEVASFHGNLIMNRGAGRAAEARDLAAELKVRVKERFGITLEEEVRYLGQ